MNLPPLPDRFDTVTRGPDCVNVWSEDDMRAYAEQVLSSWREAMDVLAVYSRSDGHREWVTTGSWLRPGQCIAVVDVDAGQ